MTGDALNLIPEPTWETANFNRLELWQQRQAVVAQLWRKFVNDYIQQLQQRPKWKTEAPDIEAGTLVLVHEDNIPPCKWRLARVAEAFKGAGGKVRVVKLNFSDDGVIKQKIRPIVKIAPLPIYDN